MPEEKTDKEKIVPEWSFPVNVAEINGRLALDIAPDEAERAALAKRFDLLSLEVLAAQIVLTREAGQMRVRVQGRFQASLLQACVVTLEPVEDRIEESFEAWFADQEQAVTLAKAKHDRLVKKGRSEVPLLDEQDDPEPIIDGKIDLGELVAQFLSLSINPFPHAPGVELPAEGEEENPVRMSAGETPNPFAALKDWKAKQDMGDS
ncbi:MAG: DUF177 domain-containing protein [Alphaproteobacteria bacterium]|nr:DUF177 domain-containing protein [Alphaproteobacteria bacterium]